MPTHPPFTGYTVTGGGGGGAPANATYLVLSLDATLTNERVFTPVVGSLAAVDGGAGGLYSLDLALAGTAGTYAYPSSVTTDAYGRVTAVTAGSAPVASTVTVDAGELTNTGTATAAVLGLAAAGTAGTYAYPASVTTDAFGRVTAATAGSAPFVPGANFLLAYFGVGYDGDVTIAAGTTTLSREMQYNNLTIAAGGILKPNGNRIFVRGTLTIAATGSINDDGNNAVGATIGANLSGVGYLRGAGGNPGAGKSVTGSGNGGLGIVNASLNNLGVLPTQGAGGTAGGANTGGNIGASTAYVPSQGWHTQAVWASGRGIPTSAFSGGGGGAGGGCDATGGTATSGGGGSGGGVVWVAAHTISNLGTISANGGSGGNAVATLLSSAGGGGGGPGGLVAVITGSGSAATGVVSAIGGAGGTGAGPNGGAGVGGSVGSTTILRLA